MALGKRVEPGKREGEWWRWNGQEVFFFFKEGGAFYREDGNEGCVLKVEDLLKIFTSLYR